jgi:hypothetical protein
VPTRPVRSAPSDSRALSVAAAKRDRVILRSQGRAAATRFPHRRSRTSCPCHHRPMPRWSQLFTAPMAHGTMLMFCVPANPAPPTNVPMKAVSLAVVPIRNWLRFPAATPKSRPRAVKRRAVQPREVVRRDEGDRRSGSHIGLPGQIAGARVEVQTSNRFARVWRSDPSGSQAREGSSAR